MASGSAGRRAAAGHPLPDQRYLLHHALGQFRGAVADGQKADFAQFLGLLLTSDQLLLLGVLQHPEQRPVHGGLRCLARSGYAPQMARYLLRVLQFAGLADLQTERLELLLHLQYGRFAQPELDLVALAQFHRPDDLSAPGFRLQLHDAADSAVVADAQERLLDRLERQDHSGALPLDRV